MTAFIGALVSAIVFVSPTMSKWWIALWGEIDVSLVQVSLNSDEGVVVNRGPMAVTVTHIDFLPAGTEQHIDRLPTITSVVNVEVDARKSATMDLRTLQQLRIEKSDSLRPFQATVFLPTRAVETQKEIFLAALEKNANFARIKVVAEDHTLLNRDITALPGTVPATFQYKCIVHVERQDTGEQGKIECDCTGIIEHSLSFEDYINWIYAEEELDPWKN